MPSSQASLITVRCTGVAPEKQLYIELSSTGVGLFDAAHFKGQVAFRAAGEVTEQESSFGAKIVATPRFLHNLIVETPLFVGPGAVQSFGSPWITKYHSPTSALEERLESRMLKRALHRYFSGAHATQIMAAHMCGVPLDAVFTFAVEVLVFGAQIVARPHFMKSVVDPGPGFRLLH